MQLGVSSTEAAVGSTGCQSIWLDRRGDSLQSRGIRAGAMRKPEEHPGTKYIQSCTLLFTLLSTVVRKPEEHPGLAKDTEFW